MQTAKVSDKFSDFSLEMNNKLNEIVAPQKKQRHCRFAAVERCIDAATETGKWF